MSSVVGGTERAVSDFARRHTVTILRVTLGLLFLWLGLLKVTDHTPAEYIVLATYYWAPHGYIVLVVGIIEIATGLGLLAALWLRLVAGLFTIQIAAALFVLILRPGLVFAGGNPFLLTFEGELTLRNVALLIAGLVVASIARR